MPKDLHLFKWESSARSRMQTRSALVLSFLVISMIPVSLLSAISFISVLKLEENIANMYEGTVTIITGLSGGHKELLEMKLDVGRFISTDDEQERQKILASISQSESAFLRTLIGYKEIDDFPLQIDILERRGLGNLTSYEDSLLTQVNDDWLAYQQERNFVISLSNEGLKEDATAYSNTVAAEKFSKLLVTYNQIVDLNNDLARIMFEESKSVAAQAFTYGLVSSIFSIAFAFMVALLVSRKLAPSVSEIQKDARKKIEQFISEERMLRTDVARKQKGTKPEVSAALTGDVPRQVPELMEKGPMILLHSSGYKELKDSSSSGRLEESEPRTSADSLLSYYLAAQSSSIEKKSNVVLITKRSSNLYHLGRNSGATIFVLSSSSQEPISTSKDGLLVISVNQTSLMLEAIKRTLSEKSESIIILDNATELIHKLGFDRVFSLVQSIADVASSYPSSKVVILINEQAHLQSEVEALATVCNTFVR